jgi:hypothetical protein
MFILLPSQQAQLVRLPFWREPVWPQLPNHRQQQQQREVILLVAWYEPDVPLACHRHDVAHGARAYHHQQLRLPASRRWQGDRLYKPKL